MSSVFSGRSVFFPLAQNFETGIPLLDRQYHTFLNLLDLVAQMCAFGTDADSQAQFYRALSSYRNNIDEEEKLWCENYAHGQWRKNHLSEHQSFNEKLEAIIEQDRAFSDIQTREALFKLLIYWGAFHVLDDDRKFGLALRAIQQGATTAEAERYARAQTEATAALFFTSLLIYTFELIKEKYIRQRSDALLKASNERQNFVFKNNRHAAFDWDLAHDFNLEKALLPDFLEQNTNIGLTIHPDDLQNARLLLQRHIDGESNSFICPYRIREGKRNRFWMLIYGVIREKDSLNKPSHLTGYCSDITAFQHDRNKLRSQRDMQMLLTEFAAGFLSADEEEFDRAVDRVLEKSGYHLNADRAYICMLSEDGSKLDNTHEWRSARIPPLVNHLQSQSVKEMQWWLNELHHCGHIICNVDQMPPEATRAKQILQNQGVKSICVFAVRHKKKIIGFIGFDAMGEERDWSNEIRDFATVIGNIVGIAFGHRRMQQALKKSEVRYRTLFDALSDAIIVADAGNWKIIAANRQAAEFSGLPSKKLIGFDLRNLHSDEITQILAAHIKKLSAGRRTHAASILEIKDARNNSIPIQISGAGYYLENGRERIIAILRDATQLKKMESEKTKALDNLKKAEKLAHLGNWSLNPATGEMCWSDEVFRILGLSRSRKNTSLQKILQFTEPEDETHVREVIERTFRQRKPFKIIIRLTLSSDKVKYVEIRGKLRYAGNGSPPAIAGTLQDVTETILQQNQLKRLAYYDAVTGLPNRILFNEHLNRAIARTVLHKRLLILCVFDIDEFKAINDRYGPQVGDKLLAAVGARIKEQCKGDFCARLSGDEFALMFERKERRSLCTQTARAILRVLSEPFKIDTHTLRISASLGLTSFSHTLEEMDADLLLRQTYQCIYQAKIHGKKRYYIFDAKKANETRTFHRNLRRLQKALLTSEFTVYYQPKVNMRTGEVVGAEALIRWLHPRRGLLPPGDFLPSLEGNPLSLEVDTWVAQTVLDQLEAWREKGLTIPVSINIGPYQLGQPDFTERLRNILEMHPNLPPQLLEIEVLESSELRDMPQVLQTMHASRALGINFSLDDFGTGYASLTYLKTLPASCVKIDQSFVRGMLNQPDDYAIVNGIMGMAKAFNLKVIAEGVETPRHGEMLLRLGCELAQGYGISPPMPAEQLPGWIEEWRSSPRWYNFDLPLHTNRSHLARMRDRRRIH